jgi:hypothetical protein
VRWIDHLALSDDLDCHRFVGIYRGVIPGRNCAST